MRRFLIIGLFALLAACTPESRHALPDEFRIAPDPRFLGAWRSAVEDGAAFVSQVEAKVSGAAESLDLRADARESWIAGGQAHRREGELRLRFYNISGRLVLAMQQIAGGQDGQSRAAASWRFATYRFGGEADERLVLHFMNERHVHGLVHAARLPGRIRGGEVEFPDVLLTASADQLAALVRATDPAVLFSARLGPLERIP